MKDLNDKVIWITGASSGIGEALALQLSALGAKLILSARREDALQAVKAKCQANPDKIKILPLDLADSASLEQKTIDALAIFGHIDILINNGGISQRSLAEETLLEVDRRIMEVNYFGSLALSKYVLPSMIKRKSGHHVVITSVSGLISSPYRSAYNASKHALHGFFNALRAEVAKYNIAVTIIAPGYVKTSISFNALEGDGSAHNKLDDGQANGMEVEKCANDIVKAIQNETPVKVIAGTKENFGIFMHKFFPGLYRILVRKIKTT